MRGAGQQYGRNYITNLQHDPSHTQHKDKVKHKSDTYLSTPTGSDDGRRQTADPLRPLKTAVGSIGTICCNNGRNLVRACLWTSRPTVTAPNSTCKCLCNKDEAVPCEVRTVRSNRAIIHTNCMFHRLKLNVCCMLRHT